MTMTFELELNRGWIIDEETEEEIGETNFVVPTKWTKDLFERKYSDKYYNSFEEFLEAYEPEVDGEFIYQQAIKEGVLIEDLGVVMYSR